MNEQQQSIISGLGMAEDESIRMMQEQLSTIELYRRQAEKLRLEGDDRFRYQIIAEYYGCPKDSAFVHYRRLLTRE